MDTLIERYQLIYQKDPESKVFAPLAEAYRKMGLIKEAIDIAEKGILKHPHFASGRVALGRALMEKNEFEKAKTHLILACDLSPENILAHTSLAQCYLKLNLAEKALGSFKMVLFLNPQDKNAAQIVQKLEKQVYFESNAVTEEAFLMQKLTPIEKQDEVAKTSEVTEDSNKIDLEKELVLLNLNMSRGEWEKAKEQAKVLFANFPSDKRVIEAKSKIKQIESGDLFLNKEWISPIEVKMTKDHAWRLEKLKTLLNTVQERRKS
ncbi:MAG: hypothetical protein IPM57_02360 [Oligoflexia bacterium]|nr:hypothetical protein [Oligoflexia bacterium]